PAAPAALVAALGAGAAAAAAAAAAVVVGVGVLAVAAHAGAAREPARAGGREVGAAVEHAVDGDGAARHDHQRARAADFHDRVLGDGEAAHAEHRHREPAHLHLVLEQAAAGRHRAV